MISETMNLLRYVNQVNTGDKRSSVSGLLYVPKSRAEYYKRFNLEYQQLVLESTARLCY